MIGALLSDLWPYIAGAVGFLAVLAGAYFKGGKDAKDKRKAQDMADHIETRRRMDDATGAVPDDVAAARGWLRDRAKRRDGDL